MASMIRVLASVAIGLSFVAVSTAQSLVGKGHIIVSDVYQNPPPNSGCLTAKGQWTTDSNRCGVFTINSSGYQSTSAGPCAWIQNAALPPYETIYYTCDSAVVSSESSGIPFYMIEGEPWLYNSDLRNVWYSQSIPSVQETQEITITAGPVMVELIWKPL